MTEANSLIVHATQGQRVMLERTPMYAYRTRTGHRLLTLGDEAQRQTLRQMSYREFRRARRDLKYATKRYKKTRVLAHTFGT